MIALSLQQIANACAGSLRGVSGDCIVSGVFVDSRAVTPGGVFVALPGEHAHGASFAAQALEAGAVAVIAAPGVLHGDPHIEVAEPLEALARIGSLVRQRSGARVVAVTGSSGKTTTKDLLSSIASLRRRTVASAASFNNEVGLPLTLARIESGTEVLVVELGARHPGNIRDLARLARPHIGIVLNVGPAHLGVFGSRGAISATKGELIESLDDDGVALLNADDPVVAAMAARSGARVLTFGVEKSADIQAENVRLERGRARYRLCSPWGTCEIALEGLGRHLVTDSLAAAAASGVLGIDLEAVQEGLGRPRISPMRMQLTERTDGTWVINDAYNANPASVRAGLEALVACRCDGRTVAVLGEMAELGVASEREHRSIGEFVAALGVDVLIGVGEAGEILVRGARDGGMEQARAFVARSPDDAVRACSDLGPGDVVLVKASRSVGLESVAHRLSAQLGVVSVAPVAASAGARAPLAGR